MNESKKFVYRPRIDQIINTITLLIGVNKLVFQKEKN